MTSNKYGVSIKRVILIVSFLIFAFITGILFGDRGLMKMLILHDNLNHVEMEISKLKNEKIFLQDQITQLEKGGIHLERYAREQLGLIADDEIVYEFRFKKRK